MSLSPRILTGTHRFESDVTEDEKSLARLGYRQELRRSLYAFSNFGLSYSIISFMTGLASSFGNAWFWGGPVATIWGWFIASLFTLFVGTSMAETCSAYPTAGGLYYWSGKLGGVWASWIAGWFNLLGQVAITAGGVMSCANSFISMIVMSTSPARLNRHGGVAFSSITPPALLVPEPCPLDLDFNLVTELPWPWPDVHNHTHEHVAFDVDECMKKPWNPSQPQVFGVYLVVLSLVTMINMLTIAKIRWLVLFGTVWNSLVSLVITFGLPAVAKVHLTGPKLWFRFQPTNWNAMYHHAAPSGHSIYEGAGFTANGNINWGGNGISATDTQHSQFVDSYQLGADYDVFVHENNLGFDGVPQATKKSPAYPYIFFCGMLMAQWVYVGYDASAHMSEETHDAARAGPIGMIMTILVTFAFGLAYIIAIVSSTQDFNNTLNGPLAINYNPQAQIMWDCFEDRFGNGRGCLGMWIIPVLAQFGCGLFSLTSNSRMLYAFSRDGAVPGSKLWHKLNSRKVPANAVLACSLAALVVALPVVVSTEAFSAVTSIAVIGCYISYVIPTICRLTVGRAIFVPGPFFLGPRLSVVCSVGAVMWVITLCVIFTIPSTFPIDMQLNFNYAPVAVGIVILYTTVTWWAPGKYGARRWFKGPRLHGIKMEELLAAEEAADAET